MEISTAHALFSDKNRPVYPDFEKTIEQFYLTEVIPVNYLETQQTAQTINGFVARATQGRVTQILKRGDLMDANMILISAIYFRGQWKVRKLKIYRKVCFISNLLINFSAESL